MANPDIIIYAAENVTPAEIDMVKDEVKTSVLPKKYVLMPEHIKREVGNYAIVNGTKAHINKFQKRYPKYDFKRTTVNSWKIKYQKSGKELEEIWWFSSAY